MTRAHSTTPLAVAADYADALTTARRAKTILFLIVLLLVLAELALFLLARYDVLQLKGNPSASVNLIDITSYALPAVNFLVISLSVVLSVVMLLLVTIMLVGRLIGVSQVTSAFIWSIVMIVVLFPWQTLLVVNPKPPTVTQSDATISSEGELTLAKPAFNFPGALYTHTELLDNYKFPNNPVFPNAVNGWGRYVGLPLLALLLLLIVQLKSSKGLRYALGEADMHVEVSSRTDHLTVD